MACKVQILYPWVILRWLPSDFYRAYILYPNTPMTLSLQWYKQIQNSSCMKTVCDSLVALTKLMYLSCLSCDVKNILFHNMKTEPSINNIVRQFFNIISRHCFHITVRNSQTCLSKLHVSNIQILFRFHFLKRTKS